jgi:SAM-dependent methyltransferase
MSVSTDQQTAAAFASSWNNLPAGSIYNAEQFADWMAPLRAEDFAGRDVLELGCGNGSLLVHAVRWQPRSILGVDLGASVETARRNLQQTGFSAGAIVQDDLVKFQSNGYDVVYCIGVLHHLKDPRAGFGAVVRNTKPDGRFHCWVYGREGNRVVILFVEPIRRLASRLPWWLTKYAIATPLAVPFYLYAKALRGIVRRNPEALRNAPLRDYCLWIAPREFAFFRHVAFDQLVTPQTAYISKDEIQMWLASEPDIDAASTYVIPRNGNSWKFGGRKKTASGSIATQPGTTS